MPDSPLKFHHLTFVSERNEDGVLVGRPDTESYAVFPADGAALLQRMIAGMPVEEAAPWHQAEYGESVDIADFVDTLSDLGFIRHADDTEPMAQRPVTLQRPARILFSPVAFAVYAAILLGWLASAIRHPDLFPRPGNVFFTDSPILVQLTLVFGPIPLVFLHEASHVLAGRRLGLRSRLGFGTRLYFLVFETRLNGLLTVPRSKRYLPFLAGMVLDLLVISGLSLIADLAREPDGSIPFFGRLLLALAVPTAARFCYQFILFLQTDVYYVFATALGCHDLHAATSTLVLNRIRRLRGREVVDTVQWTERDLKVARWYAPFFAFGVTVITAVAVFALIPILVRFVELVLHGLTGHHGGTHFWDSAVTATLNVLQIAFFVSVTLRTRARRRRAARQPAKPSTHQPAMPGTPPGRSELA